ncbi:P-loop containing nucleoside triphosphate hydrolases superfamily protein [Actinidia rufa]|uniref:Kinesin-like protein KIN-10A n=1 Tax=Actinidia rufa TaxID=165716 RepID=A0A7J0EGM5_9ERIC|nr:P-loop containing nucleoside triphosphate hydrolases superfamily protein [Actinidia rufa]
MAPTPAAKSNCHTPSSKSNQTQFTNSKTPNPNTASISPSPNPHQIQAPQPKTPHQQSTQWKTEIGYRDFSFDGISLSEEEDLDGFYKKFVASRINGVKLGAKCTIMMYGPTGSGKSHTMFGCAKQQGIVYRSLKDILGEENEGRDQSLGVGPFVQVTVLEIYNEELYDLLSTNNSGGGLSLGWSKGSASKVRLEVMGKKAKNATFISGNEAAKISKEIQKVEKRRIVKSTLCNERSSRSHCMIILDVPMVGGQLMLVDMAGSENIEQAGQIGLEAKMQRKINQGNIALKRVVESIANGDSHVPFRDSKLTMLLQDSFEDDKSKILMILCASPDPKEMHKTISTLEYGAKAKCIVRGPHTPLKDKNGGNEDSSSAVILGSRIAAMDRFIFKLQMENKQREKERNEAHKQLMKKEEEISALRAKLASVGTSEEEINLKVNERTQMLKRELEKKILECENMATEFVELERRKMEKRILQQQQELELLRYRLEEIELELLNSSDRNGEDNGGIVSLDGSSFAKRLLGIYSNEDPGMEKSMDLDRSMDLVTGKQEIFVQDTKYIEDGSQEVGNNSDLTLWTIQR